ncbi:MAG: LemA family protein [Tenericutes bacterium HGW-Tenericutes-8]|nr:MAG: LemA family protein [Tenericutes bacterium HGW-Tenericutes-8]
MGDLNMNGSIIFVVFVLLGLLGLGLIGLLWAIVTTNMFKRLVVKVDEAESGIDVALEKRYDLLTKMVSATKGYAAYEEKTLKSIVELRKPTHQSPIGEKQAFANQLTDGMSKLNVVLEQYPDLKASVNFLKLQEASMEVEENLQAARRVYNANVSTYNQKIVVFPNSVIANFQHYTKKDFFEVEANKRKDVEFNF